MINQQLIEYVRAQRSNGLSKEAIIQALGAGGWTSNDVNEAFMAIDGVKTPPPPPPPPTPNFQNPPRTIVPPPGAQTPMGTTSAMPGAAPTPTPPAPRPVVAASEFSTAQVKKRRSWPWVLLLILFVLIIGGGVFYATFLNPGVIALPNFSR
jgi:hypothetical protein